jgi:hypothetical protein
MANATERICFTETEDELLAKGWPRMARLVDGHPHDKNATKSALAWLAAIDPKYRSDWPREVAHRAMRAGPIVQFVKTQYSQQAITAKSKAAIETAGPLSKDEARSKLVEVVRSLDQHTYAFKVQDFVYLIETVLGAEGTLDAIAEGFETSDPATKRGHGTPMESYVKTYAAGTIGFLLLRAKPSAALRKRLEAQHQRFDDIAKKSNDWSWCAQHFDLSLHGAAAFKRMLASGWRISLSTLEYAHDDPDLVRECVAEEPKQAMTVRLAKIGGVSVLEGLAKRKFSSPELLSAVRDFGMVRSPDVVELVLSLVGKSAVKDAPIQWLAAHADYAKPLVARSKSTTAKAALARMG